MSLSEDDSDRNPESSYADSIHKDHEDSDIATPSPIQESSQGEYTVTPTKKKTSSIIYSTSTSRSGCTERCSPKTRLEFQKMYKTIYKGYFCLITQEDGVPQIVYVIPPATKGSTFKLYEYCLGLEYKSFHVNSRSNLFILDPTWRIRFDNNEWFLLPDAQTLENVHHHVKAAIKWRQNPNSKGIKPLRTKWRLGTLTKYTFIPVCIDACIMHANKGKSVLHDYPYPDLPLLKCHILPPYAVINAGQKLCRNQVDGIVHGLHADQTTEFEELKQRLTLLCDIWDLFIGAQDAAKAWGKPAEGDNTEAVGSRKRKHSDSGQTNRRSTRSKSEHGGHCKCERSPNSIGDSLTEKIVSGIKRQTMHDWRASIKQWIVESTRASSSVDLNLPPDHYTCTSLVTPPEKC